MSSAERHRKKQQDICDRFNAQFSVGDTIRVWSGPREGAPVERTVRFPASVMGGHTAMVYVAGGGGSIALTHVEGFTP